MTPKLKHIESIIETKQEEISFDDIIYVIYILIDVKSYSKSNNRFNNLHTFIYEAFNNYSLNDKMIIYDKLIQLMTKYASEINNHIYNIGMYKQLQVYLLSKSCVDIMCLYHIERLKTKLMKIARGQMHRVCNDFASYFEINI